MKKCRRCSAEKSLSEFSKNRSAKDGYQRLCKPCHVAVVVASKQKNPEAHRAAQNRWKERHWDKVLAQARRRGMERRASDPSYRARINAANKKRYEEQRETIRAKRNADPVLLAKSREQARERSRKWRAERSAGDEKKRLYSRIQAARRRSAMALSSLTVEQWEAVLLLFDGKCAYCGRSDRPLTIDHVTPLSRGGAHAVENVVPACKPCNSSKGSKTPDEWRPN